MSILYKIIINSKFSTLFVSWNYLKNDARFPISMKYILIFELNKKKKNENKTAMSDINKNNESTP